MSRSLIAQNRKAFHEYQILEKFEGGMVLVGSEVKAIREGKANLKEAYVRFIEHELFVIGMHIGEYSNAGYSTHNPVRDRKLLLHRQELNKIKRLVEEKGKTLIPLSLYLKKGRVKIEFGLAQGKKLWDKRKTKQDRDLKRQVDRAIKNYRN
ncbi:MAG: SsrA-binding protein SmpB [Candidatus Marinimicrobia bacterium]|jgi:SsrA-binding protein|nr:SsrA-binding protein SmpB [Candidatus Neomarinimicrobiota bacterium]MDP7028103.1 SsrA-binding protein SmpB [Candidatus Neomarinimicrobiota bacterium]